MPVYLEGWDSSLSKKASLEVDSKREGRAWAGGFSREVGNSASKTPELVGWLGATHGRGPIMEQLGESLEAMPLVRW